MWAYIFFDNISKNIINFRDDKLIQLNNIKLIEHVLLIDNRIIKNEEEFIKIIERDYSSKIFDENTKVHFKLKLNLHDYLLLNNVIYPTFMIFNN